MSIPKTPLLTAYMAFYLEGRDEKTIRRRQIDVDLLAEKIVGGEDMHEVLVDAATRAASNLDVDRKRREWCDEMHSEIQDAGGNANEAYRHYIQGRIDELAFELESPVLDAMCERLGIEPEDDDEEDEDEDGEGE